MRTLKFIVEGQIIKKDPKCDFSGLVPGTSGYLQAEFSFSPEWDGCAKAAGFSSKFGKKYPPAILKNGKTCVIPAEALERTEFKINVVGMRGKDYTITTNNVTVSQNGGVL